MQPGPITATTIVDGAQNRYAGGLIAVGHAVIEFPLMVLIMLGMDKIFKSDKIQIVIGLAGGVILLIMAIQMWITSKDADIGASNPVKSKPVIAGIVLSASNPYFLIWWATIGLKLATDAKSFGILAFPLFAITHWAVDCGWLLALSWASFQGKALLGQERYHVILKICSVMMFALSIKFVYDSISLLISTG
ncbi:MAG: LysE family transporter [Planctomycetota bacterium]